MTRAPASASREERYGAATACSMVSTSLPPSGRGAGGAVLEEKETPAGRRHAWTRSPRIGPTYIDLILYAPACSCWSSPMRRGHVNRLRRRDHAPSWWHMYDVPPCPASWPRTRPRATYSERSRSAAALHDGCNFITDRSMHGSARCKLLRCRARAMIEHDVLVNLDLSFLKFYYA